MGSFEFQRQSKLPPWLDDEAGRAFVGVPGAMQDAELRRLKDGVLARFPLDAPDDALDALGRNFQLERYPGEADAAYRGRLAAAWEAWTWAGTKRGVAAALEGYGIADVAIREDWEGTFAEGEQYSRFWVFLGPDLPWDALELGEFELGGSETLGSTATAAEIAQVKRLVLKWKSSHGYPVRIVLAFEDVALLDFLSLPFTLGGDDTSWVLGRTMADTLDTMPFTLGGYEV